MDRDNATWLTDLRLVGSTQEAALVELRAALLSRLRRGLGGRLGQDAALADDIVQDALVRILARLNDFRGRSLFLTWATSIAIRLAMTEIRRRRWRDVRLEDLINDVPHQPTDEPASDARDMHQAIIARMRALMSTVLTDKQRAALEAELRGMPQDEIARHLGTNRNALYKLAHDARKRLKLGLESAGYGAAEVQELFA